MAANAAAAIAAVQERAPDLVLTDIYMPDADGFELINALRDAQRHRAGDRACPAAAASAAMTICRSRRISVRRL